MSQIPVKPARPGAMMPEEQIAKSLKSIDATPPKSPLTQYNDEVREAIEKMKVSKVHSPMFNKTFDQLNDWEIVSQIDHWYNVGKGMEMREQILSGYTPAVPKLLRYLKREPINREQRRRALRNPGYYHVAEYAGDDVWIIYEVMKNSKTILEKITNKVKPNVAD